MSTLTDPHTEILRQANNVALKAAEIWSQTTSDIVAQIASLPRNYDPAAFIDTLFDARKRVLDLQHEAATDLAAATTSAVESFIAAMPGLKAWNDALTKKG